MEEEIFDKIVSEMELFQIPVPNDDIVKEKLVEICEQYWRSEVDDFIADLEAFRLNFEGNDDITQDFLLQYVRGKKKSASDRNRKCTSANTSHNFSPSTPRTPAGRHRIANLDINDYKKESGYNFDQERLDSEITPKRNAVVRFANEKSFGGISSPCTFSPAGATPSAQFRERQNAGQVLASFGDVHTTSWIVEKNSVEDAQRPIVKIANDDRYCALDKPYTFMYQTPADIVHALDDRIDHLANFMLEHCPEIEGEFSNFYHQSEDVSYICGQICVSDANDESCRLTIDNIMLRASEYTSKADTIAIDFSALNEFSIFPGQVVCVGGKNLDGKTFIADKMYPGVVPSMCVLDADESVRIADRLSVVVAAGPFTTSDGLGYEPLVDLLTYVEEHRPNALILVGPIVPSKHNDLLSLPLTYQEFYEHIFTRVVEKCDDVGTQVVLVASSKDACVASRYPTPPLRSSVEFQTKTAAPVLVPDPCLLNVGGLVMGISATDVLFHLNADGLHRASDITFDRMGRLVQHLFQQQTFYPLYPPATEVDLEMDKCNMHASLCVRPHVLILPSDLRYFLKVTDEVLAINPGRLTKGRVGGTFCRFEFDRRKLAERSGDVTACISAQVIRI